MTEFTVDWVYGTDTNSVTCSTVVDLSSVASSDRQDASVVATFLQTHLDASVFTDLDAALDDDD